MQIGGKPRSQLQIFAEILDLCKEPQAKTRIMIKANLSYTLLQQKLAQLQTYGFLKSRNSKATYLTTYKGLKFLQRWTALQQLLMAPPKMILFSRKNNVQLICETDNAALGNT